MYTHMEDRNTHYLKHAAYHRKREKGWKREKERGKKKH